MSRTNSNGWLRLASFSALLVASTYLVWVVRRRRQKSKRRSRGRAYRHGAGQRSPEVSTPVTASPAVQAVVVARQLTPCDLELPSPAAFTSPAELNHAPHTVGGYGNPITGSQQRSLRRSVSEGPTSESVERLKTFLTRLPGRQAIGDRRIELLVHNVSHKDMILSMTDAPPQDAPTMLEDLVICRPRFSMFEPVSEAVLGAVSEAAPTPLSVPVSVRERENASRDKTYTLRSDRHQPELPVGFDLSSDPVSVQDMSHFRFRQDDGKKVDPARAVVNRVYFPLLASILPKWCKVIGERTEGSPNVNRPDGVFKIIFLVSGIGMPRDSTSDVVGNSTEGTCKVMEKWLKTTYPGVHVVRVHSATNIFRYDENIAFVKTELLPLIEYYRDMTAERWGTEWRSKYRITISFADGSPARISAINASLRPYRPSFVHMWELKTFWHHAKMCLEDVEVHTFEDIDTLPPVLVKSADRVAQLVAGEMMKYRREVLSAYVRGACSDLTGFWLRKTQKPVLAILLVQKPNKPPTIYRGCNMEVSMPTGSLCAERNAIGSALAADLTLSRRDLKIVAVLSLSFKNFQRKGLGTSHSKFLEALDEPCTQPLANGRCCNEHGATSHDAGTGVSTPKHARGPADEQGVKEKEKEELPSPLVASPPRVTILRNYSVTNMGAAESTQIVGVQPEDMNPLKPCGACMEWLKKIAEMNPEFRVATFTDELCQGVYTEFISTEQS